MWYRFLPLALVVASTQAFTSTGTQTCAKRSTFREDLRLRSSIVAADEAVAPIVDFFLGQRIRPEDTIVAPEEAVAPVVNFSPGERLQPEHNVLSVQKYLEESRWRGTRAHLICALASVATPLFMCCSGSALAGVSSGLTKLVIAMGFAGLVFDNLVNASGRYLGEGNRMRRLSKARTILHSLTIPLLYLPVVEIAMKSGLVSAKVSRIIMTAIVAFGLHEVIDWMFFDIKDMILVDSRDSKKNTPRAVAGTLWYSSGKVLKNVIPAVLLQLFMLGIGSVLWSRGAPGGSWLFASGAFTMLSCSLQRPDIQAFGEVTMIGLLWQAAGAAQKGLM